MQSKKPTPPVPELAPDSPTASPASQTYAAVASPKPQPTPEKTGAACASEKPTAEDQLNKAVKGNKKIDVIKNPTKHQTAMQRHSSAQSARNRKLMKQSKLKQLVSPPPTKEHKLPVPLIRNNKN